VTPANAPVTSISVPEAVDGRYVVVDVRSPREFNEGHVPHAVNLPLLDDAQRAMVGTAYTQRGAREARMLAVDLIGAGLPLYLRSLRTLQRSANRLAIMCWRGGERSRNVVLLLALVGVHAVQIEGGYKAYRRWVLAGLQSWRPTVPVFTLFGYTGAGKTEVLRALARLAPTLDPPRPIVVDLEALALHRGSLLGGLNQPGQRTQKDFEALLWDSLRRAEGDYLLLEGEGNKIGRLLLPATVGDAIRAGRPVQVTATVQERAQRLLAEYAPGGWDAIDVDAFRGGLDLISGRLPRTTAVALRTAFEDGRFPEVVTGLLQDYYDPLYQRSSVEGREFVLTLSTGPDPIQNARRLAAAIAGLRLPQRNSARV
jgi:tRNA 2-selenouridine synthase